MSNFNSWPVDRNNNNGYAQPAVNANGNNFLMNGGFPSFEEFNNQFQNGLGAMLPPSFTPVNLFANPPFTPGLSQSLAPTQPSAPLSTAASEDGEIDEVLDDPNPAEANAIMIYLPAGIKGKNTSSSIVCENVGSASAARELFRTVDRPNIVRTIALDAPSKGFIVGFSSYNTWRAAWENAPRDLKRLKRGETKQQTTKATGGTPLGHAAMNGTTPNGQTTNQTGTTASEDKANLLRSKLLAMKMKTPGQEELPTPASKSTALPAVQSTPSRVATPATIIPPGISADVFSSEIDKLIEQGRAAAATNGHAANGLKDKVEQASKAQAPVIEVNEQSNLNSTNKPQMTAFALLRASARQKPAVPLEKPKSSINHIDDSSRKNGKLDNQQPTPATSHSTDQAGPKAVDEVAQYQKLQEISKRMASQNQSSPKPSRQAQTATAKPIKEDLARPAQKPAAPIITHVAPTQTHDAQQQQSTEKLITPKSPNVYASSESDATMMDLKEVEVETTEASSQAKPQEISAPKAETVVPAPVQIPLTVPAQQHIEPIQAATQAVQAVQDTVEPAQPVSNTQDPHNYYEDLEDWLEITGYHDVERRSKIVARHRKRKDLEAQLAQLELESQLETPFPVRASVQPQPMEDVKTSMSMPPPPLPFAKSNAVAKLASIHTSTATTPNSPVFPAKSMDISKAASTITTTATCPNSPVFSVADPRSRKRSVSQVVDSTAAQRPSKNIRTESTDDPRQRAATYSNSEYPSASYDSRKYDPTYSPRDYSASYYQYPSGSGSTSAEPLERRVSMPNNKKAYYNNSNSNYGDQRMASRDAYDAYDYRDDYYGYTSSRNRGRGDRYRGGR